MKNPYQDIGAVPVSDDEAEDKYSDIGAVPVQAPKNRYEDIGAVPISRPDVQPKPVAFNAPPASPLVDSFGNFLNESPARFDLSEIRKPEEPPSYAELIGGALSRNLKDVMPTVSDFESPIS